MYHMWKNWRSMALAGLVAVLVALIGPASVSFSQGATVEVVYGYTYQRADGNRLIAGEGALPGAFALDIDLDGRPTWVVAAPLGPEESVWVAVLDDGRVQGFRITGANAEPVGVTPAQLPLGMPPLLAVRDGVPSLVVAPPEVNAAPFTHPLVIDDAGTLAVIGADGELVLVAPDGAISYPLLERQIPIDHQALLRDGRLVVIDDSVLLALASPTDSYAHGALGDPVEAAAAILVDLADAEHGAGIGFGGGTGGVIVSEAIMPIFADLDGDGNGEAIFTLTDVTVGAREAVATYDGTGFGKLIAGPAIGTGFRWRHQIAVAPFGLNGETELVVVRTPHIGGIVEFYRFDGESLAIVATLGGYTSHGFGSRNLDRAAAGDFDGDGRVELLVQAFDGDQLAAIRRTDEGAEEVWRISTEGPVRTNLAGATLPDGRMLVGVGRADGVLRVWLPLAR